MAHEVTFTIPSRTLGRSDVEFHVYTDEEMLGTLKVSKGTLVWFPANTIYGYRIGWKRFDKLMQENIKGFEKR
jgi:hypothetical protein